LTAVFDFRADAWRARVVAPGCRRRGLIVDGVFLLRPELRDAWDLRVFVRVSPEE
jgi:uridine kinase